MWVDLDSGGFCLIRHDVCIYVRASVFGVFCFEATGGS